MPDIDIIPTKKSTKRNIEIIAVVIICIATIASAWCVYEAARWTGKQAFSLNEASALRAESVRATTMANTHAIYDMILFQAWHDASSVNQTARADRIRSQFSKDFRTAFDAWIASAGPDNPLPSGTPFQLPEYQVSETRLINQYVNDSEAAVVKAEGYNQVSDNYLLNTVLFALVLFLAGISTRWESKDIEKALLVLAVVIGILAFAMLLTQPVSFGYDFNV